MKNFTSEGVERLKIARDLHDTLAQELAAIGFACDEAIALSPLGQARDSLLEVRSRISLLGTMVRDEIGLLREGDQSFFQLISNFCQENIAAGSLEISNRIENAINLPSEICIEIFRAVREILSNILLHAKATAIEITSNLSNKKVKLIITDNGMPFDPLSITNHSTHHFGLLGARERIERVNGQLEYFRQGTENIFQITLP